MGAPRLNVWDDMLQLEVWLLVGCNYCLSPTVNRRMLKVCVGGRWTSVGRLRLLTVFHKVFLLQYSRAAAFKE